MQVEELNEIKAEAKQHLTEIGYARWKRHLIKCLRNLPMKEARQEIIRYANEIANREMQLKIRNLT